MKSSPEKHVALDVDCNCKAEEGCYCLTAMDESEQYPDLSLDTVPDLLITSDTKCSCRSDPKVAERLNRFVTNFLTKKFRSKKWLKSMFKDKVACALSGVYIKTRIILPCNPNSNVPIPKTPVHKRRSRRKRVP